MTDSPLQTGKTGAAEADQLSYTSAAARGLRAQLTRAIEKRAGLQELRPLYEIWRKDIAGKSPRMMNEALAMIGTRLDIHALQWPMPLPDESPIVIIANHPFGIGDGIAALALAEDLGRPYRVLLNKEFMRVPEIHPVALPIDFSNTREAVETNLRTRNEARALMKQGVTMVIFPAGGVATARWPWGRAEELPWKVFAGRLIQMGRASILPVYFEGQNSAWFHAMSRFSGSLRMPLLVAEFQRFIGSSVNIHVGPLTPFQSLSAREDRAQLMDELYVLVHQLAPHNCGMPVDYIKPVKGRERPAATWDQPVSRRRGGDS